MPEVINTELEFGKRVDFALLRGNMSRRELIEALKEYGFDFTDTKMSNRCNGVNEFQDDEKKAIEKFFKKQKIEF